MCKRKKVYSLSGEQTKANNSTTRLLTHTRKKREKLGKTAGEQKKSNRIKELFHQPSPALLNIFL